MNNITDIVRFFEIRTHDRWGEGHYGASRGGRTHNGIDIVISPHRPLYAWDDIRLERIANPYANDARYSGAKYKWGDFEVKVFYFHPIVQDFFSKGDIIGVSGDLTAKYPGITPHIHFEMRLKGEIINPEKYL